MNALVNLGNPAAVGDGMRQSFRTGLQHGQRIKTEGAIKTLSADPGNAEALGILQIHAPKLAEQHIERQRDQRFSEAAISYYQGPDRNALAGPPQAGSGRGALSGAALEGSTFEGSRISALGGGSPSPQRNALAGPDNTQQRNAFSPVQQGASFDQAFAPEQQQPQQPQQQAPAADFSSLGAPRSQQDAAFLRMLEVDPKRAFEIDGEMRDRAADRLKLQRDSYGYAVQRFGGVTDEAGYQDALADIAQRIEPLGVEITDHLPPNYPGPEGLRQLRLGAIEAEDQASLFMREANIEADNNRADRNTDSMIETRDGRLAEYHRANSAREANQRRGQNMTDSRVRSGRKGSSGSSSSAGSSSAPRQTATDGQGNKVEWDGKVWVPVG